MKTIQIIKNRGLITWKITMIFLLFGTLLFSENYPKEKIIRIIEKNEKYECVPDKKVRKIGWELNGQSFIGHLDENGERYGEFKEVNDDALRECYLEDEYINYYKNRYFYKENKKISLIVSYGEKKDNIQLILKNTKDISEVYFFERKGKKYKRKNLIMTFDPAIIFYPSDLIKEKSE